MNEPDEGLVTLAPSPSKTQRHVEPKKNHFHFGEVSPPSVIHNVEGESGNAKTSLLHILIQIELNVTLSALPRKKMEHELAVRRGQRGGRSRGREKQGGAL